MFDVQINGFGGVDFQRDAMSPGDLLRAARQLRAAGCTRFFLTLMTDAWPRLLARLERVRRLRARHPELRQAIAGWHLEGPFLSPEPGFCGAHDPRAMIPIRAEHVRHIRAVTGADPVLLTLSPTWAGAPAAIAVAVRLGMRVSLGHTDASQACLRRAVRAGATGVTHLGNGCPAVLDRADNILWRVLDTPGLIASLIPDRVHVSPPLFRLIHRVLGAEAIYYTSDAMAAAGLPPGTYTLGRLTLEVGPDRVVRLPGTRNLAGSAVSPLQAVFRAAAMRRCAWQEAWSRLAQAPARFVGLPGGLEAGGPADFCVLDVDARQKAVTVQTFWSGRPAGPPVRLKP